VKKTKDSWNWMTLPVVMIALATLGVRPASAEDAAPNAETTRSAEWTRKMRALQASLQELLVDLSSEARFNDPKNQGRIRKNAEALAKGAHKLTGPGSMASPDKDPSLAMFAAIFAEQADHAYKSLEFGQRAYSRNALKSVTGYCIACHTRTGSGPQFATLEGSPVAKDLKPVERAEFFAAVREYDRALAEFEKVAADRELASRHPWDWERAVREGVALAVRARGEPDRAMKIIESVLQTPNAPIFLKEQAAQWKKSVSEWKKEREKRPAARSEASLYADAQRLLAGARQMQRYPIDRSADILYLRAGAALHELLQIAPQGKRATEAMYLAGLTYEVLQDPRLGGLHEMFYLGCIQRSPHTEQARRCFQHLESSVYYGYTGSGGTHLPDEVKNWLRDLDQLSGPANEGKPAARP
jgi:hypothetical protein